MASSSKTRAGRQNPLPFDLTTLSGESKKIVDAVNSKLEEKIESLREEFRMTLEAKTSQINNLESEVSNLKNRIDKLEERIDDGDAYERRDTLVFSGEGVPAATSEENPVAVVCGLVREKLKISL